MKKDHVKQKLLHWSQVPFKNQLKYRLNAFSTVQI